ncbi:hypothetical protein ANCCAN_17133 [Ancylostoma caninum]|uniref:Uncharacterized protein n=1 Tax=Ancylostoma caninum TaxID=29170 RepID=A0A368G313_ANCCA|nr:hypothetical protein ANCCAN_17133 [Ancylostoma caninum]
MIASLGRRVYSIEDMKGIAMQQRSFSAEDTSCDKENQFDGTSAETDVSRKEIDDNDSTERNDGVDFSVNDASTDTNSCEGTDRTERTLIPEEDQSETLDAAGIENTREEEIRRIEEAAYTLTDGVELPRASDLAVTFADDENCESFRFWLRTINWILPELISICFVFYMD